MASIDRRQTSDYTHCFSRDNAPSLRWIFLAVALSWGCFPAAQDIQCLESSNCNRFADGVCRPAPSGHRWCSYPDSECQSGYRYSDLDVGDELSGECTETPGQARWVQQVGGTGWDWGNGVAVDGDGNVIAVGAFSESLQLGATTLTSAGGYDSFVIKLDGITGDVIWAKHLGGPSYETAQAVQTDASNNIYVMGTFSGTVDLGGGELQPEGSADVFVLKLTPTGEHVWSRGIGGVGQGWGIDLAVRDNAIAIVSARSEGLTIGSQNPSPLGQFYSDIYIVMLTTDGESTWSKTLGGASPDYGWGIALDSIGNMVVVGEFGGTVDFGSGPVMAAGYGSDAFVAKYAGSSGAHLFSKRIGGLETDAAHSVAIDAADNLIVVGYFRGAVDFGGPVALGAVGHDDIFVAKYTLAGGYLWARSFGTTSARGSEYESASSVAINDTGDPVLTGEFCGTISFGGAEMSSTGEYSDGVHDIFVTRLMSSSGDHVSSMRAGSRSDPGQIALTTDGRPFLIGSFHRFAEIGGRAITPVNGNDAFVLALAPL